MLMPNHFDGRSETTTVGLTFQDLASLGGHAKRMQLMNVSDETNQNLTKPQKELLLWHQRLCHADMQRVQNLMREPQDPLKRKILEPQQQSASSCDRPLCTACQLSKQGRQTPDSSFALPPAMDIRQGDLKPGECVSIDQYESSTPGRLKHTKGKEPKKDKFIGGTIFVDHATSYIHLHNQVSLRVGETLCGKQEFEQFAKSCGVIVKSYLANNQPFSAAEFV